MTKPNGIKSVNPAIARQLNESYAKIVELFNSVIGTFLFGVIVICFIESLNGHVAISLPILMFFAVLINIFISKFFSSLLNPLRLELIRTYVIMGPIVTYFYVNGTGIFEHWWISHFVMVCYGSAAIFSITKNKMWAMMQGLYWIAALIIGNLWLTTTALPWMYLAIISGLFFAVGVLLVRLINFLSFSIEKEVNTQQKIIQASKLSALGEMAGGIAHEINNPLTIIVMSAEQIDNAIQQGFLGSNDPQVAKISRSVELILKTSRRVSRIISGLRTLAKDSDDEKAEPISLFKLIQDTLELCQEKLKHGGIDLQLDKEALDHQVFGQPIQLSQVVLNLLQNSYDAISNLDSKWIRIEALKSDSRVLLKLTDSGKGIPEEIINKVFQPFFSTKDVGSGMGLGLSISKSIMQKNGGDLLYEASSPNTQFIAIFQTTN